MAVTKENYNYNAKNEVRERFKNFVKEAYPSERQRKDLSVLTLMGHETTELEQVWDPLGIPRENITSIENNKDAYRSLAQKNPGINLVYDSIEDFVKETERSFDVINLDYHGPYSFNKARVLQDIAYGRLFDKEGILSTWYSGRRDRKHESHERENTINGLKKHWAPHIKNHYKNILSNKPEAMFGFLDSIEDQEKGFINRGSREDFVSLKIMEYFMAGICNFEISPVVEKLKLEREYLRHIESSHLFDRRNKNFRRAIENGARSLKELGIDYGYEGYTEEAFQSFKNLMKKPRHSDPKRKDIREIFKDFHLITGFKYVHSTISRRIENEFESTPALDLEPNISNILSQTLLNRENESYVINDSNRIKYHSDNGTPMYADFLKIGTLDFSSISDISLKSNGRIKIPKYKKRDKKFIDSMKEKGDLFGLQNPIKWSERKYVKSS